MDTKKLGRILLLGGVGLIVVAVAWWAAFYSKVLAGTGAGLGSAFECFYSSTGECQLIGMMARMGGMTPYNPVVLWAGALGTLAGLFTVASTLGGTVATTASTIPVQDTAAAVSTSSNAE